MYRRVIAGALTSCAGLFVGVLIVCPVSSGANISDTVKVPVNVNIVAPSDDVPSDDSPSETPTLPPHHSGNKTVVKKSTPTPSVTKKKPSTPAPSATLTPQLTPDPTPSVKATDTTPSSSPATPEGE